MCEKYSKTGFLNNLIVSFLFDTYLAIIVIYAVKLTIRIQNLNDKFPEDSNFLISVNPGSQSVIPDLLLVPQALLLLFF